jgi:hypothetical protein
MLRRYGRSVGLVVTLIAIVVTACLADSLTIWALALDPDFHPHDTYYIGVAGLAAMAGFDPSGIGGFIVVISIGVTSIAVHDRRWNTPLTIVWCCVVADIVLAIWLRLAFSQLALSQPPHPVSGWRVGFGRTALFALVCFEMGFLLSLVAAICITVRNAWRVRWPNTVT